jgi:hypothetical protein
MGGVPDTDKKVGWSQSHRRLIKKLSIFLPFFRASTIHLGLWPLPAQVSPEGYDILVRPEVVSVV